MQVSGLAELHDRGGMRWTKEERGWEASAIWVARARRRRALVFIEIDGARVEMDAHRIDDESHRDQGGEG
jgi:hypothetical protein